MLIDAIVRQRAGRAERRESAGQDSFVDGLLDCPHYTRPEVYAGAAVPAGAAVGQPRGDRALAAEAGAGADVAAAAGAPGRDATLYEGRTKRCCASYAAGSAGRRAAAVSGAKQRRSSAAGRAANARQAAEGCTRQRGHRTTKPRASGGALRCAQRPTASRIHGERSDESHRRSWSRKKSPAWARRSPMFAPGDTVIVNVNVVEGERKRVQAYEGVVIAKRNRGLNSSFVVRKISQRRGRRAHVPDLFAADRLDRGQAPRRRPPRQALLPARPLGQVGADPREALAPASREEGRVAGAAGSRAPPHRRAADCCSKPGSPGFCLASLKARRR